MTARASRILYGLVVVMAVLSVAVGVLLLRDRHHREERQEDLARQFTLVCDGIANLREGLIGAFGRLGTDLNDPAIQAELRRIRADTDCDRST